MFRSGTVVGALPPYHLVVPSSRACGQKGGCQMGVGVFQPSEMEVVMSEHRFVITDRLWQSAPLLPGKATDRGATSRPDDPVRTTPPLEAPLCAGASTADGPASQLQLGDLLLAGSNPLPNEVAWAKVGRSSFTTCGCAVSGGGQAGMGRADMKKGALRPPVHTTSGEDQKVRVGRTAMANASESAI